MFHRHHDKTEVEGTHHHGLLDKIKNIGHHHHHDTSVVSVDTSAHINPVKQSAAFVEPTGQTLVKDEFIVQKQQPLIAQPLVQEKVIVQKQEVLAQPAATVAVHTHAYDVRGTLEAMDTSHVVRTVVQDAPIVTTKVIQGGSTIAKEVVHVVPVIHKEIHERDVIYKDIIHEKHLIEKELHEVPIHVTEHVKHDTEVRGVIPQAAALQRQVIQEQAIIDQQIIKDQAVLRKVVEHERNHVTKEIHERALVNKEVIHERPIIERELRENALVQKEFVRDNVIVKNNIAADIALQKEYINEGTTVQTQHIKEKPILVSEVLHERPVIQKEIYHKDVITKDIIHEQPIIEKHLVEKAAHLSEVVKHDTIVQEKVVRQAAIHENISLSMGSTVSAGQGLRWLDNERFEIEGQGRFRRYHQKYHGHYQQIPQQRVFIMKKGMLERFSDKIHHWNSIPVETIYILE